MHWYEIPSSCSARPLLRWRGTERLFDDQTPKRRQRRRISSGISFGLYPVPSYSSRMQYQAKPLIVFFLSPFFSFFPFVAHSLLLFQYLFKNIPLCSPTRLTQYSLNQCLANVCSTWTKKTATAQYVSNDEDVSRFPFFPSSTLPSALSSYYSTDALLRSRTLCLFLRLPAAPGAVVDEHPRNLETSAVQTVTSWMNERDWNFNSAIDRSVLLVATSMMVTHDRPTTEYCILLLTVWYSF